MVSSIIIKGLFANSGGLCAYPDCKAELYDIEHDSVISQIAHIRSEKKDGPRYDPDYPMDKIDSYDNLVVFCHKHHKIVDDRPDLYSIDTLQQWKKDHEKSVAPIIVEEKVLEKLIQEWQLIINIADNFETYNVTSHNQMGGQTAGQIYNVGSQPRRLTREQAASITSGIVSLSGSIIEVGCILGDTETFQFANQVKTCLESAGISVKGVSQSVYTRPILGIHILTREVTPEVRILGNAIGRLGYKVTVTHQVPRDGIKLIIGSNV